MKLLLSFILIAFYLLDWFPLSKELHFTWPQYLPLILLFIFISLGASLFTKIRWITLLLTALWFGHKLTIYLSKSPMAKWDEKHCSLPAFDESEELYFGDDLPPVKKLKVDGGAYYRIPDTLSLPVRERKVLYRRFSTLIRHEKGKVAVFTTDFSYRFERPYSELLFQLRTSPLFEIKGSNGKPLRVLVRGIHKDEFCSHLK